MKKYLFLLSAALFLLVLSCKQSSSDDVEVSVALSGLSLSQGTLTPAFSAGVTSYTATVENTVPSVTVTPKVDDSKLSISVDGAAVASGTASPAIALTAGETKSIPVVVSRGTSSATYTVAVARKGVPAIQVSGLADYTDTGSTTTFVSGTSTVYFGWDSNTASSDDYAIMFTIKNIGTASLTLTGTSPYLGISGTHADHFSIPTPPANPTIPINGEQTFIIKFAMLPTSVYGVLKTATLTIPSNDPDGDFILALTGDTC